MSLPAAQEAAAAEGEIRSLDAPDRIAGSFIVKMKEDSGTAAESLASRFGGRVEQTYENFGGFHVLLSEQQAKRLAADPAVEYVEQDQLVHVDTATEAAPPSWGLDRIDQRDLPLDNDYDHTTTGSGVNVYVVDTGVRISHKAFGGRARYGYDFIDRDRVAQDGNGHGTHVAGTIAGQLHGVATSANIIAVRVLNNKGSGSYAAIIAGIDWVARNHRKPAVANLSLGGAPSGAVDNAVRRAISRGVVFAIAAGNSNNNAAAHSPARVAQAITVGATDITDTRATYSNYGKVVDLFAPGTRITSAWNNSDTATNTISGTSMATPHVAGAAARYLSAHRSATPAQVASYLKTQATAGKVKNPGSGSPNRLLYLAPGV